ncbi:putative E3 ubiquitin-protein ligase SINA-like 6 [Lolium rigidum]|uniref:putative E3 ubiquitin-protein ligase SINA-like 6 n=1 Tax=Lolium rigidum TaxID=89674 RepID=UPI001F5D9070|nr:putative E3 ubiquitin-protein ligase SINA-like 6 [Lolium rigidum]
MEAGDHSGGNGKRARGDEEVKPEEGEVVMQDGEEGRNALAVVEAHAPMADQPQMDLRMDVALLHCQACLLPLKPPVFKCEAAGHVVCCYCRAGHGDICSRANTHCGELDAVVGAAKVPCPYKVFGCERYVVYHESADHQRVCQCAPCACPEPGCAYMGSRGMLLDHFAAAHSRLATALRYGRSWNLSFPLSHRWHVLVGEEDKSVFLLLLGALGAATAVSLVCVRADGAPVPQFWCKLSVERPGDDKDKLVLMASTVGTSALTGGAPAPGKGMFLAVPQELLYGDMLALCIRIDQLRPAAAAPSPSPRSTTPQARIPRKTVFV